MGRVFGRGQTWAKGLPQVHSEDGSRVDVLFVGGVGLGVLAGGLWAGLWAWLDEQSGSVSMRILRLASRSSLERMFSVFLAAIGRSRATQRSRARRGRRRSAKASRIC